MTDFGTGLELVLNAAESVLQIAFTDDEKPLAFQEWRAPKRGTEILAPALQHMCDSLKISLSRLRRIACVCGPGSFTGIRLVLSTAAGLRRTTGAQLASLDYMQALATSAVMWRGLLYGQKVAVLTHARRDLVHYQPFISYGPQIPAQPLEPVSLISPAQALGEIAASPCHVCGGGLERNPAQFALPVTGQGPVGAPEAVLMPELVNPILQALCLLARHGDYFPDDLEPKYVRSCDAVDNLEDLARRQGRDPAEAARDLESLLGRAPASEE